MIIGVDLDDVLLDFFGTFCDFINEKNGTKYDRNSLTDFYLEKSWGWTKEAASQAITDFYASAKHVGAAPVKGAVEAVSTLSKGNTLHIITSKPDSLREITEKWVYKNYPGMFAGIHFMNQYHSKGEKRLKADVCKELGATILIEDSLEQAQSADAKGIRVLMLDAPWNQKDVRTSITRVKSWNEIVTLLS